MLNHGRTISGLAGIGISTNVLSRYGKTPGGAVKAVLDLFVLGHDLFDGKNILPNTTLRDCMMTVYLSTQPNQFSVYLMHLL